ncbi:MAG: cytochrome C [Phycisphaeraceae bacterium]|nr:cytochrome C [Phycisphaeraceae bacterium]
MAVAMGVVGLAATTALAVDKPTTAIAPDSCVTAECHANVKDHAVLHGPVNVNGCDACHTLTDAAAHSYQPARPANELCLFCHQVDLSGAKVVHEPMKTGDCMGCHDPHGGADRTSLKSGSVSDLCNSCHAGMTAGKSTVHGPVAAGACDACHTSHVSDNTGLLKVAGKDLCLGCHMEMKQQLTQVQFVHQPLTDGDCTACHDAHASNNKMMILKQPMQLCTDSCHADVKHAVTQAKFKHSAVTENDACANCHNAHGSDLATLMLDQPVNICLKCHEKPVTTPSGQTIAAVNQVIAPKLIKHGPVADGSCGGCHNVHGSDVDRLLIKPYPDTFYASFSVENYELCFTCHEQERVLDRSAKGLTNFRDGDLNLHFVHVNKDPRGRSCRACHETHASTNPLHVRESVPYGNWSLPINFVKSDTGGSCSPGCHQPFAYDREQAVNDVETMTTQDINPQLNIQPPATSTPQDTQP